MDKNGDGKVSIQELTAWWNKKQTTMSDYLFEDPTKKWGNSPATTSREVSATLPPRALLINALDALSGLHANPHAPLSHALLPSGHAQVGWFTARRAETNKVRRANQAKWRLPKDSCAETLYATEYVKFAGTSPFSNQGRAEQAGK